MDFVQCSLFSQRLSSFWGSTIERLEYYNGLSKVPCAKKSKFIYKLDLIQPLKKFGSDWIILSKNSKSFQILLNKSSRRIAPQIKCFHLSSALYQLSLYQAFIWSGRSKCSSHFFLTKSTAFLIQVNKASSTSLFFSILYVWYDDVPLHVAPNTEIIYNLKIHCFTVTSHERKPFKWKEY